MEVQLVAIARGVANYKVRALRDVPELPEEGSEFQVRDLGHTVVVDRVFSTLVPREIRFAVKADDVTRLRSKKGWTLF